MSEHASPLAAIGGVDAGGQNVHVAALSQALADRGHEVVVYTRRDDPDLPVRVPMGPGVAVVHVDAGPPEPIPKDDIFPHVGQLAAGLAARWSADRPDVIHSHFWMSGLAALEAASAMGIPVVHTFHALGTVKRRHQGRRDTSPKERISSELAVARACDRVVATCTDELFELVRLGADVGRVSIVPCGVDTDLFRPGRRQAGPTPGRVAPDRRERYRLVAIGRLVERKGVDEIIRALAEVPDTELMVAGGPDINQLAHDPDVRRLEALARTCGVADRVHFIGRLGRDEVPGLLSSADAAVCVPWYEPFGIVPLEAMSCAVPVVASAVGGLTDTVVNGVTGLHVTPRQPAELAAALRTLLPDRTLRRSLGAAGRARAVRRYKWTKVADATAAAYQRAIEERPSVGDQSAGRPTWVALG
ncbi:MAG TPA: glycosyltransferase [Acidimicrobiales bacterium]|nr:glycosyltransferase [Acidimicrobiales bacterium]